jgi:hypothetical protein
MRLLSALTIAVSGVGAAHAIERGRTARMFGIRLPGTAAWHAATIGTALSAPPAMLATLVFAERTNRQRIIRVLAVLFFFGILSETDTWTALRRPGDDPTATIIVVAEIALPLALLRACEEHRLL